MFKYNNKECIIGKINKLLYSIFIFIVIAMLFYISIFQDNEIYTSRNNDNYLNVDEYRYLVIKDESKPVGLYEQYKWIQSEDIGSHKYLVFHLSHQYSEVYIDGKMVYSIMPKKSNKIGKTTAGNWVMIPIEKEDINKEVLINIIPAYDEKIGSKVNFFYDTKYNVYKKQFKEDFVQILLGMIAVISGIVLCIMEVVHKIKKVRKNNILFLGVFSLSIGLWKITDVDFAPLVFKNTLFLSYITLSTIYVGTISFLYSTKSLLLNTTYKIIDIEGIICSIILIVIQILQLLNIYDLRELLWIVHIMILIIAFTSCGAFIYEKRKVMLRKHFTKFYLAMVCFIYAVIMDIYNYYVKEDHTKVNYTLIAFLLYIIAIVYTSIRNINIKAKMDTHTGLFNKGSCNDIIMKNEKIDEDLAIIMFDLNNLKKTNDCFGHEYGDIIIREFADILKASINSSDFIGRFGGDEFIAVIKDADDDTIHDIVKKIDKFTCEYNNTNEVKLSYAYGYELSSRYPGYSLRTLLKKADDNMYDNKKKIKSKEDNYNL